MKKGISGLVRVLVSFGLLGLLVWFMRKDAGDIVASLVGVNFGIIGICAVLIVVNVSLQGYRLKIIFLGEDIDITLRRSLELTFVGYFFNNFMPTAVGGDIVKAHYAGVSSGKRVQSYASVFMDRMIGLYTFIIVAAIALIIDRGRLELPGVRPIVFVLMIMGIAGYVVLTHEIIAVFLEKIFTRIRMFGIGKKLNSVYAVVHDYRNRRDVIIKSAVTSLAAQLVYFSVIYLVFIALGEAVTIGNIMLIMPVVIFVSMLPSIGGLGVREGAIVALFTPLVGKDSSFAASLLVLASLLFISLIGGLIYAWWGISGIRVKGQGAEDVMSEVDRNVPVSAPGVKGQKHRVMGHESQTPGTPRTL